MKVYVGFVEIETDYPIAVVLGTNKKEIEETLQSYSCNLLKWVEEYDLSNEVSVNLDLR
jgi:hypothetical protein